ncbi:MAG: carotenoid cleavage dioxygenase-like enzyme [Polyangiales bacterium]|jgi:carotenoid cleavage dioxygenase-like enzyme
MDSPYLEGSFAPAPAETSSVALKVIEGEVPRDLFGSYVRNGPNPEFRAEGRHHWFDGDGMLHGLRFENGEVRYQSRWVQTPSLEAERAEGHALWKGVLESANTNPDQRYKDTGNTDVIAYGDELLAFHYMGGAAWRLHGQTFETLGRLETPARMSAHAKVDPVSGELIYFDYGVKEPFLTFGRIAKDGTHVTQEAPVERPVFPHDMAFTKRFGVLMAPPVSLSAKHAAAGRWGVEEHPDEPFRFVLMPRGEGAPRVFEASNCYVYHVVDAWDDGEAVELVGFRSPKLFPKSDQSEGALGVMMANLRLRATLHRWRFDLTTGQTHEEPLDERNAEFPTVDLRRQSLGCEHAYAMTIPTTTPRLRFDGVLKYAVKSGAAAGEHSFGPGRTGSEVSFAARDGSRAEDDGYLVSLVQDEGANRSEAVVLHAESMELACRLEIPTRVPLGFHACWAPGAAS